MEFPLLDKVGLSAFLSEWGRKIYLPQGIFYWSGRAKKEAEVNATLGAAAARMRDLVEGGDDSKVTCFIPFLAEMFPDIHPNDVFPYVPILGKPSFRWSWRDWIIAKGGKAAEGKADLFSLPMTTSGITGGLFTMIRLLVDPGERIVSPDLRWGNYDSIVKLNLGLDFEDFPTFADGGFNLSGMREAVFEVWKDHPKATLILNFPNNPTGYTPSHEEAEAIRDILVDAVRESGKKLTVLCDDAYEGYVYDGKGIARSVFYDFLGRSPNLFPIKLDGATKEFLFYGGRLGMITFGFHPAWLKGIDPAELQKEIDTKVGGIVRTTVSNCCHITQTVVERALANMEKILAERQITVDILAERATILKEMAAGYDPDEAELLPCNGGFFGFISIKGVSATQVAEVLLTKYKIAVVPTEKPDKGINGIRFAFCGVPTEDMRRACEAIPLAIRDAQEGNGSR